MNSQKPNILPGWADVIVRFSPKDGREERERAMILDLIAQYGDGILTRGNDFCHMTASSIIVSQDRRRTLMAFHKIYNSWAWTGGHADGESDFEAIARREAQEETSITDLKLLGGGPASIEILPVWAHVKKGKHVGSHLHLNVSYLFEADENAPLRIAEDENSAVGWLEVDKLCTFVTEPPMMPIYERLLGRANDW
ncbi:MAG: NUDIX hydrolase [Clostridia bacterium]|nr:NUDIX hydrolase [Clostridia bacterium]